MITRRRTSHCIKREKATFLSRCPLNFNLRVAGFALGELCGYKALLLVGELKF